MADEPRNDVLPQIPAFTLEVVGDPVYIPANASREMEARVQNTLRGAGSFSVAAGRGDGTFLPAGADICVYTPNPLPDLAPADRVRVYPGYGDTAGLTVVETPASVTECYAFLYARTAVGGMAFVGPQVRLPMADAPAEG